jgi:hypothetical protein
MIFNATTRVAGPSVNTSPNVSHTLSNASDIPGIVEPLFAGLKARVELLPVMNADDLKKGLDIARQAM